MTETAPTTGNTPPPGSTPEPVWGGPVPPKPTWSRKKTLATVAVAVVLGGCAGAAIYAAGSGSGEASGPGGFGPGAGPFGGPGGMSGAGSPQGRSLHGEFVVASADGGYTTELTQTGKVTAVSGTSVTAVSADDYSHTYVIDTKTRTGSRNRTGDGDQTDGRAAIAVGDTVFITATVAGDKATATSVLPADATGSGRGSAGAGAMPGGMPPGGEAMPGGPGGAMPGGMPPGAPPQAN